MNPHGIESDATISLAVADATEGIIASLSQRLRGVAAGCVVGVALRLQWLAAAVGQIHAPRGST